MCYIFFENGVDFVQSEYGNDYVDPYVVLASLGFGVFLFNIIYNLLNRSARSVEVSDMNLVNIGLYKIQFSAQKTT